MKQLLFKKNLHLLSKSLPFVQGEPFSDAVILRWPLVQRLVALGVREHGAVCAASSLDIEDERLYSGHSSDVFADDENLNLWNSSRGKQGCIPAAGMLVSEHAMDNAKASGWRK